MRIAWVVMVTLACVTHLSEKPSTWEYVWDAIPNSAMP